MSEQQPPAGHGGQPPVGGYGPPPEPYGGYGGYVPPPPDHPDAVTVLVLGILGIVACQIVAPFAWSKGNQALQEIEASQGTIGGRTMVQAGRICGIVGTILLIFTVVLLAIYLVIGISILWGVSSS